MDLLLSCQYSSDDDKLDNNPKTDNKSETKYENLIPGSSYQSNKRSRIAPPPSSTPDADTQSIQQPKNPPSVIKRSKTNDNTLQFIRSTPHIRGNWCGHVFFELDNDAPMAQSLQKAASIKIQCLRQILDKKKLYDSQIFPHHCMPSLSPSTEESSRKKGFHISLSRPFYLQNQSIVPFVHQLQSLLNLESTTNCTLDISNVYGITPDDILVNDDETRSFLVFTSPLLNQYLKRILNCVNEILIQYCQKEYYKSPKIHVSIASIKGNVKALLFDNDDNDNHDNHHDTEIPQTDSDSDSEEMVDLPETMTFPLDQIVCTFGTTKRFVIPLRQR